MKDNHIKEFLDRKSTKSFLVSATELIEFLEASHLNMDLWDYLKILERKLAKVYSVGLELEQIEVIHDFDNPTNQIELKGVDYSILEKLEKNSFYCDVFDPTCYNTYVKNDNLGDIGTEVTQGWLLDDIGDIYTDICPHLRTLKISNNPGEIEHALWQLYFGFNHHWGKHCIGAMRFLFHYGR